MTMTNISAPTSTAVLFGATGATGRQALSYALQSSTFSTIHSVGRRPFTFPCQGVADPTPSQHGKLTNVVVPTEELGDPTTLAAKLSSCLSNTASPPSAVIVTLASTRADAGSDESWERLSRHYVVNAARAARSSEAKQKLLYCSSGGADPTSRFLYMRMKGMTEQELSALGYDETIIFRPGYLRITGGREQTRWLESGYGVASRLFRLVSAEAEIETAVLGRAMGRAAELGIKACLQHGIGEIKNMGAPGAEALVISNSDAVKLANLPL